jgi:uncharacterized protein
MSNITKTENGYSNITKTENGYSNIITNNQHGSNKLTLEWVKDNYDNYDTFASFVTTPIPAPLVIDTSVFTNSHCYDTWANNPLNAICRALSYCHFYMTPGCIDELKTFLDMSKINPKLLTKLHVKNPNVNALNVPATIVCELVSGFRNRGDATLKFATSIVKDAYKVTPEQRQKGSPDPVSPYIVRLRDGIRHHLRDNFIDSEEDMNTLLLATELGARLVTGDLGMIKWAKKIGIECIDPVLLLHL